MMNKKRLAAKILKVGVDKVKFAPDALEEISKALTRSDLRGLIAVGKIYVADKNWQSFAGARKNATQKRKGRRKNIGSRKGAKYSKIDRKTEWINRVRMQRGFITELKEKRKVSAQNFRILYQKIKGGYFRNKRHIKLYLKEYKLIENDSNDHNKNLKNNQ
jgi:large subunit ribosomal protein L19e